ncbi:MAG: hypothetical protein OEX14_00145 [Paracoccaceae bacterium]|nr:hypothetical protein [Paracoccaceae bacterium]
MINFDTDIMPLDQELGRRVLEKLHRHYPGWSWVVDVPPNQNLAVVRNFDCDPRGTMGFIIYKTALYTDPTMHKVMLAGGEFLERYKVLRAGFRPDALEGRTMIFEKPQT